jgi:hypothetical protein
MLKIPSAFMKPYGNSVNGRYTLDVGVVRRRAVEVL